MIRTNKIRCKFCGDVIESTSRHGFKWCKCGNVGVGGGKDCLKRAWNPNFYDPIEDIYEELSEYTEDEFDVNRADS